MSKAQLKKELATFSREQLLEVVLGAYDSSKEAHDYFEFFLDPDIDALIEKYAEQAQKEAFRTKRGNRSKCRITVIKKMVRQAIAYGVGPEDVLRLYARLFFIVALSTRFVWYSEAQLRSVAGMAADILKYADRHGIASQAVTMLRTRIADRETMLPYLAHEIYVMLPPEP